MVTKPHMPSSPPRKMDPPIQVGGKTTETSLPKVSKPPTYRQDEASPKKDLANKDHNSSFKLPEKVSQSEIKDGSFKYGGGRSAGNRSLAENIANKIGEK